MLGTPTPDPIPLRHRRDRKKMIRKLVPSKILILKEAIPKLRDNYFLTLEDNQKCRQDNYQSTWKAIGRYVSRKVEYSKNLDPLFDKFEVAKVYLPDEPRSNQ